MVTRRDIIWTQLPVIIHNIYSVSVTKKSLSNFVRRKVPNRQRNYKLCLQNVIL